MFSKVVVQVLHVFAAVDAVVATVAVVPYAEGCFCVDLHNIITWDASEHLSGDTGSTWAHAL